MKTSLSIIAFFAGMVAPMSPAQQIVQESSAESAAGLPAEEQHLRAGIVLLGTLYQALASVQDAQSAQATVPTVVRLSRELHAWGQAVSSLPPLSEQMQGVYRRRYMPTIDRLNDHLRVQGERLAASDYFGVQDLSTALISLYCTAQQ